MNLSLNKLKSQNNTPKFYDLLELIINKKKRRVRPWHYSKEIHPTAEKIPSLARQIKAKAEKFFTNLHI